MLKPGGDPLYPQWGISRVMSLLITTCLNMQARAVLMSRAGLPIFWLASTREKVNQFTCDGVQYKSLVESNTF